MLEVIFEFCQAKRHFLHKGVQERNRRLCIIRHQYITLHLNASLCVMKVYRNLTNAELSASPNEEPCYICNTCYTCCSWCTWKRWRCCWCRESIFIDSHRVREFVRPRCLDLIILVKREFGSFDLGRWLFCKCRYNNCCVQ